MNIKIVTRNEHASRSDNCESLIAKYMSLKSQTFQLKITQLNYSFAMLILM